MFTGLDKLRVLLLQHNSIVTLDPGAFKGLASLDQLLLAFNVDLRLSNERVFEGTAAKPFAVHLKGVVVQCAEVSQGGAERRLSPNNCSEGSTCIVPIDTKTFPHHLSLNSSDPLLNETVEQLRLPEP